MRIKHESILSKAVRLDEDLDCFLEEHPELSVVRRNGKIVNILFPEEAENITLIILDDVPNNVYAIQYAYNGRIFSYHATTQTDLF